jgi:carbonic anhydrase/acetyltransferase-like protein (isoleucine patch superfamily)
VLGDVEIGEDCIVLPGAVVRGDFGYIKIGNGVWIEDNVVVHGAPPGLEIGDKVTIGHGAVINGRKIGSRVLIGINACILHDVEIGDRCIIAAGAVVTDGMKIPDGSFVAGIPAKIVKKTTDEQLFWVERDPLLGLAEEYKKRGW